MKRRDALWTILGICALPSAHGQEKTWVIGLLDAGERPEWWAAFRQQLRDLGYVEGRNVRFELHYARGKFDQLPRMAEELIQRKADVIVTSGTVAASTAKRATDTVPIVMATGTDPVALGIVKSLSRPGENITGVTSVASELSAKRFALMREISPGISQMAVVWHRENVATGPLIRELLEAADAAKVGMHNLPVKDAARLAEAFAAAAREHAQAMMVIHSPLIFSERKNIAALALKHRLPTMNGAAEYVDAGGLASYAPSYPALFRRAAVYTDRILKGAKPGDLPIERPTTFEFVLNQKAANALGISIPLDLARRADRVIGAL